MIISSGLLSSRISNLAKIISYKNAIPTLDNIVFKIKDGECQILAGDIESQVVSVIQTIESDDISFGLDARMLLDLLKELAEQPLIFNLDETMHECTVNYNNGKFCIPMTDISEYPKILTVNQNLQNTIKSDIFRILVNKCAAYTASDELRAVMNGIYFDFKDVLTGVASDGHSLIKLTVKDCQIDLQGSFILSNKNSKLCESYVGKQSSDVIITYNDTHAKFVFEDYTFVTRLIEGRYPNYNSVIPSNYTDFITVERKSLLSAIKRVSVFASSSSNLLEFNLKGMQLELQGRDIDFSTSSMETLMVSKNGIDIRAGLKSVYMTQICSTVEQENINIFYKDSSRAFIYKPEQEHELYNLLLLQMPMMIND